MAEEITVAAPDGHPLGARWFPPAGAARAVAVIASATGVRRGYYEPFASCLADGGIAVFTFDYRGIGASRPPRLRGFEAHLHEWGEKDLEAMLAHAAARVPDVPLLLVGHSVGGQIAGLAPSLSRVAAMLTVASQSGYWGHWRGARRLAMLATWHLMPVVAASLGYLPMGRLVGGEDLPRHVAAEWARWGRHRDYLLPYARARGARGYGAYDRPLHATSFTDDPYAPPSAAEQLLSFYPRARVERRLIAPADVGAAAIGHFGFFRERFRDTLWLPARAWLLSAGGA